MPTTTTTTTTIDNSKKTQAKTNDTSIIKLMNARIINVYFPKSMKNIFVEADGRLE